MIPFAALTITTAGQALISEASLNGSYALRFTRAESTAQTLSNITALGAIPSPEQSIEMNAIARASATSIRLDMIFSNYGLAASYQFNAIGIYAQNVQNQEILFAAANRQSSGAANFMPTGLPAEETIVAHINTGDAQVSLQVPAAALVSRTEVDAQLTQMRALITEARSITASLEAAMTKLAGVEDGANKTTIVTGLTETVAGKALDATEGKALNEKKLDRSDVVEGYGQTIPGKAADAKTVAELKQALDDKPNTPVENSLTSTSTTSALAAVKGKELQEQIGALSNLTTSAKGNLAMAINEAYANFKSVGGTAYTVWVGTAAAYNAILLKSPTTLYFVT